jgi:DNA-directed RNA polymerase subunit M/transcription elongation factor TFIIS
MKFCPSCEKVLLRTTLSGEVKFQCSCGLLQPGTDFDTRIAGGTLGSQETSLMYSQLLRTAAFDRTNHLIERFCYTCGLNYMTLIRVGENESIIYKCKCGNEETS